ncbi:MAG: HAD family hydrolase [Candidatus Aenigmarchaeota archaeon]|nr:HAD family hydrolase [Candidatus Aenigmarchaeota archaeon]
MIRAIIFDFDGVIHDTFDFHRMKLKQFTGHEISKESYRDIHDGNFYEHEDNVFINTDWDGYVKFIHPEQSALKIKDEIRQVLIELSKKYELFIISSGCAKNISDYLGNNGISKIFTEVLGFENHKSKVDKFKVLFDKYGLCHDNCVFITDTLGDILEANKVGVETVAVDFGFHSKERLEKGRPYKIISCFNEIIPVIDSNF